MPAEFSVVLLTAASIAVLHTAAGPDHYVPFVALAQSRGWTLRRTVFWVLLCGCGHVGSSVVLALAAAALGWSLSSVHWLEGLRGTLSSWALFLFGLAYIAWSLWQLHRNRLHRHFETEEGALYIYQHRDRSAPALPRRHRVTPWVLFLVFVLGPCEPMLPLLYLPAVRAAWWAMATLIVVYTVLTLGVMVLLVLLLRSGVRLRKSLWLERYMPALCGAAMAACGATMIFLGW